MGETLQRRRGLQVAIGVILLVIAALGMLGTALGCAYAVASDQVGADEAGVVAAILLPAITLGVLLPAVVVLTRRSVVATVWGGLVVPGLALAERGRFVVSGIGSALSPFFLLTAVLTLPIVALTLVWLFTRAHGTAPASRDGAAPPPPPPPPVRSAPVGEYRVIALGNEYGPYSSAQLVELAAAGHVSPQSTLRFNGGQPFSASELVQLFS